MATNEEDTNSIDNGNFEDYIRDPANFGKNVDIVTKIGDQEVGKECVNVIDNRNSIRDDKNFGTNEENVKKVVTEEGNEESTNVIDNENFEDYIRNPANFGKSESTNNEIFEDNIEDRANLVIGGGIVKKVVGEEGSEESTNTIDNRNFEDYIRDPAHFRKSDNTNNENNIEDRANFRTIEEIVDVSRIVFPDDEILRSKEGDVEDNVNYGETSGNFEDFIRDPRNFDKNQGSNEDNIGKITFPDDKSIFQYEDDKLKVEEERITSGGGDTLDSTDTKEHEIASNLIPDKPAQKESDKDQPIFSDDVAPR